MLWLYTEDCRFGKLTGDSGTDSALKVETMSHKKMSVMAQQGQE